MTEREWERKLGIRTDGRENVTGLRNAPYEATPYPVLERLLPFLAADDIFLDCGCGKGRCAIFASRMAHIPARGYDMSERLIRLAQDIASGDPLTRFTVSRAEGYRVTDETALFFFNPFSAAVLEKVLQRVRDSLYERPRRVRLFFYYPTDEYLSCLASREELLPIGEIDCRDLFGGRDPRERIVMYRYTVSDQGVSA